RVEREHRRGVEVVAGPRTAPVVVRRRIRGAPVHEIQDGIVGAGHPAAAAAELARVAAPALRVFFDRVELPGLVTRGGFQREDLALNRQLAGRLPENHLVLHGERGAGEVAAALLRLEDLFFPRDLAGLLVEREDASVQTAEVHTAIRDRDTAVVRL